MPRERKKQPAEPPGPVLSLPPFPSLSQPSRRERYWELLEARQAAVWHMSEKTHEKVWEFPEKPHFHSEQKLRSLQYRRLVTAPCPHHPAKGVRHPRSTDLEAADEVETYKGNDEGRLHTTTK
ncbi:UNVERIFIED_CONTAM: hypothetical protein HHA_451490 [Hammondia hammondi]|eukprot:XP_008884311.1 hypothetical protein HHA_451490 [Hammondia hammondi]